MGMSAPGEWLNFIAAVVDGRDPDLGSHQSRVGQLTVRLAERAGCSADEVDLAATGAQIHDVGKLSIPEQILNKPGRLTDAEFMLVKHHAAIGYEQVRLLCLDPRVGEIVLHHHENFDGTGYPEGLRGSAIPLLARIARIVDTFDAVTMDRPYRKGVSNDEALTILDRSAYHYDSNLLSLFRSVVNQPALASE